MHRLKYIGLIILLKEGFLIQSHFSTYEIRFTKAEQLLRRNFREKTEVFPAGPNKKKEKLGQFSAQREALR
jgi:hypothetical protein